MVDLKIQLPESFLEEEERCGYLVSHEMKKAWAVMLDLLAEFDRVCKKHSLKYYATGGTLLGSVRHEGFIPWDDDIDLMMFREDYNKLMKIGPDEFRHPYFLQNKFTDPTASDFLAKFRNSDTTSLYEAEKKCLLPYNKGIFIDIFPYDNVPDDVNLRKAFFDELEKKRNEIFSYGRSLGIFSASSNSFEMFIKNTLYYLLYFKRKKNIKSYLKLISEYDELCSQFASEKTEFVTSFVFGPKEELFRSRNDFSDCLERDFEFLKVPICSGFHHFLTDAFGDYMKFVRGTSWHSEIFFDTDKAYKEYTHSLQ